MMAIILIVIGLILLLLQISTRKNFFNFKIYDTPILESSMKIKNWIIILLFLISGVLKLLQDIRLFLE